jgi:small subunit ribosomal protein S16
MKRPFYRLVVVDSRNRRDGRYIENLGTYNPVPRATEINLNEERILHWLGEGAEPSGTAENLIRRQGLMEKHRLLREGVAPEELEERLAAWKAKQPRPKAAALSRMDKKAQKKEEARSAAEAAKKAEAAAQSAESSSGDVDGAEA